MSNLPEHIRIGGIDYAVSEVKGLRDGNTGLDGHIIWNRREIRVEQDMDSFIQWVTIWHEVIHGILEHAGIGDVEEQVVMALGYGVTQVIRDNSYLRNHEQARSYREAKAIFKARRELWC